MCLEIAWSGRCSHLGGFGRLGRLASVIGLALLVARASSATAKLRDGLFSELLDVGVAELGEGSGHAFQRNQHLAFDHDWMIGVCE